MILLKTKCQHAATFLAKNMHSPFGIISQKHCQNICSLHIFHKSILSGLFRNCAKIFSTSFYDSSGTPVNRLNYFLIRKNILSDCPNLS